MSFAGFPEQQQVVQLLQRSLSRGRLGHAYLFCGDQLAELEDMARTLAKTLNCREPRTMGTPTRAVDCCDRCPTCRKIDESVHADIHYVRPESKLRVITIRQVRELMEEVHLKPAEADFKVAILVAADRLNAQAANAFLKTLEEPPQRSVLVLLTTEPQRVLETILSRCLRLNFAGGGGQRVDPAQARWLEEFSEAASRQEAGLLGRYRLLGLLLARLGEIKAGIEQTFGDRSPLNRYEEIDVDLKDRWEDELAAAIEAEYRRQRIETLAALQWWLRDVWLKTLALPVDLLRFPGLAARSEAITRRIGAKAALTNLSVLEHTQRLLHTNVQEALALEVGLLKLQL